MSTKALERHLEPILPFIKTNGVTEICINKPGEIYVERDKEFTKYLIKEFEYSFLENLAGLVAEFNYKDFPQSLFTGSLPTGERVQFVMSPACESNKIVCSIRRHQIKNISLEDFERERVFDEVKQAIPVNSCQIEETLRNLYKKKDILSFIKLAILNKKNILISGGTGTGKTTFLNSCLKIIPPTERIITVEDSREVKVDQPNAAHLIFNEEDKSIDSLKIFKACLRLRPDRIFLSELRGTEVWPYLRASSSGHPGTLSTVHADNPDSAFKQLTFMMQQAGSTSSDNKLNEYIKSIINIVIQLKRHPTKDRFMYVSNIYFDAVDK